MWKENQVQKNNNNNSNFTEEQDQAPEMRKYKLKIDIKFMIHLPADKYEIFCQELKKKKQIIKLKLTRIEYFQHFLIIMMN